MFKKACALSRAPESIRQNDRKFKKFSDNTLVRALINNAWLNSSIIYDSEEARGAKRQTLLATILHKRGICDEVTQLKPRCFSDRSPAGCRAPMFSTE